jgi:hypothetical protein
MAAARARLRRRHRIRSILANPIRACRSARRRLRQTAACTHHQDTSQTQHLHRHAIVLVFDFLGKDFKFLGKWSDFILDQIAIPVSKTPLKHRTSV